MVESDIRLILDALKDIRDMLEETGHNHEPVSSYVDNCPMCRALRRIAQRQRDELDLEMRLREARKRA